MRTRKEYLDGKVSHDDYYNQFVTKEVIEIVKRDLGVDTIKASNDPHFNDIPLKLWDRYYQLNSFPGINEKLKQAGDFPSNAGIVCIAKAAARMIKGEV